MFECTACTLRCIRAIAGDAVNVHTLPKRRLARATILANHPLRRHASTAIASKPPDDDFVPFEKPKLGEISYTKQFALPREDRTADVKEEIAKGRPKEIATPDKSVPTKEEITRGRPKANALLKKSAPLNEDSANKRPNAITIENKSALIKELEWLPDRLKLAQHVHYVLRCNDPEKALNLCRLASKKEEVIVSWNHVVDWYMRQGKVDDALKVYNEMKKRAQFPDAHTYTLILRGLAAREEGEWRVKARNAVRAVAIYNSLSSPTSRVKPNIFHTNATLKVCSDAADMDALWGIVSKLPDSGPAAPDRVTYGIIINAIRKSAFGYSAHKKGTVDSVPRRQDQAISEGRAVWKDIIARWRAGEVILDEQLVLSMARLLLESPRMQDWDDVLNLFQQTMKIERLIPPLGSPERKVEHVPQLRSTSEDDASKEDNDGWEDTPSGRAFLPVSPSSKPSQHYRRTTSLAFVRPDSDTLTTLINACMLLRIPKTAGQYWDLLTSPPFDIKPKHANFHIMLRLLRRNRASAKAVALVRDGMSSAGLERTHMTYVLAMVACVRDMKNQNVLGHARELIDLMQQNCDVVAGKEWSVESVILYLMLSLSTDSGPKIIETLNHLHPIMKKLELRVKASDTRDKEVVLHLFRNNVGVINALHNEKMIPPGESALWIARKAEYSRFITHMAALDRSEKSVGEEGALPRRWRNPARENTVRNEGDEVASEDDGTKIAMGRTEPALQAFRRRQEAKAHGQSPRTRRIKAAGATMERRN
jgi:pentatricopeptide repeat protein